MAENQMGIPGVLSPLFSWVISPYLDVPGINKRLGSVGYNPKEYPIYK